MSIETMISTIGFPIVAFLLMYKLCTDTIIKNTEAINGLKEMILRLIDKKNK